MKKIGVITILLIVSQYLNGQSIFTGSAKFSDKANHSGIEVRLYFNSYNVDQSDIVSHAISNSDGDFQLEIPEDNTLYKLHITYPNYEGIKTKFAYIDNNPRIDAILHPASISKQVKEVSIVGDFNEFDWSKAEEMTEIEDKTYSITIKHKSKEMRYQFLFDTENHSFSDIANPTRMEYDHGGDYYSIAFSNTGEYQIAINLNDYPTYTYTKKFSSLKYEADSLIEFLDIESKINQLNLTYHVSLSIAYQNGGKYRDSFFEGFTKSQIDSLYQESSSVIFEAEVFVDSLLNEKKSSEINDLLLDSKLYLLIRKTSVIDFATKWDLFNRISNLSYTRYDGLYGTLMYYPDFRQNAIENLSFIENKISNSYIGGLKQKKLLLFNYSMASAFGDNPEYSEQILRKVNKLELSSQEDIELAESIKNKISMNNSEICPSFSFIDLEGERYDLSDFNGKWVFLDFWATWCGPCKAETNNIKAVREAVSRDTLVIISIAKENDKKVVSEYVNANKMSWMHTLDPDNQICSKFGVSSIPTFFLIDPNGKIVKDETHFRGSYMKERILKAINSYK